MQISSVARPAASIHGGSDWPLTGGVPCQLSSTEESGIGRVYIGGYQDGSVRMWDATHPILSSVFTFQGQVIIPIHIFLNLILKLLQIYIFQIKALNCQVQGIQVAGLTASVSSLELCVFTLNLAVGNESGLVRRTSFPENSSVLCCVECIKPHPLFCLSRWSYIISRVGQLTKTFTS